MFFSSSTNTSLISCFTCRKWCTIFKSNMCIIFCIYCYISCNKNKCIRIITKTWFNPFCFKLNSIALLVITFCCLTVYNVPNLDFSLLESFNKFIIFLWKLKSYFFWFFNASSSSRLPIKLNCSFKSEFSNSIYLLKSIAISL